MKEDISRTATVICNETTELFQIDSEDFAQICQDVFEEELEWKVRMTRSHPLFSSWEEAKLRELCLHSVIIEIPYGKVIERDWSRAKHVYYYQLNRSRKFI